MPLSPDVPGPRIDRRHRLGPRSWTFRGPRWVNVSSSWVQALRYDASTRELDVRFRDGAECRYHPISLRAARDFFRAGSMGRFVWRWLYYLPYELLAAGTGKSRPVRRGKRKKKR